MTLVSLSVVPVLPADPDVLSAAVSDMSGAARTLAPTAEGLGRQWRSLPEVYDTPESAQLVFRFHPVRDVAIDLVDTTQTMTGALAELATALAVAEHRFEQLLAGTPLLRARTAEYWTEMEDLSDTRVAPAALSSTRAMCCCPRSLR